jgi:hypothetical protein
VLDLDRLMARVRAEVETRKRQQAVEAMQSANGVEADTRAGRTADELLRLPDAEFVRESYAAIFGRAPQERELTELRDRLLTGQITRLRALRELLKTEEAKQRNARVEGLSLSIARDSFRRSLPGRWLARLGHTIRTIYLLPRRIRQFLKRIDTIERLAADTASKVDLLDQKLAETKDTMKVSKG